MTHTQKCWEVDDRGGAWSGEPGRRSEAFSLVSPYLNPSWDPSGIPGSFPSCGPCGMCPYTCHWPGRKEEALRTRVHVRRAPWVWVGCSTSGYSKSLPQRSFHLIGFTI